MERLGLGNPRGETACLREEVGSGHAIAFELVVVARKNGRNGMRCRLEGSGAVMLEAKAGGAALPTTRRQR